MQDWSDAAFGAVFGIVLMVVGAIVAPAYMKIRNGDARGQALTLRQAIASANAATRRRRRRRPPAAEAKSARSKDDEWTPLFLIAIAGFVVVRLYTLHREPILWMFFGICVAVFAAACISIVTLSRNDVLAGSGWSFALLWGVLLVAVGVLDLVWLVYPAFHQDYFARLLEAFQSQASVDFDSVFFVAYQIVGAAAFAAVAFSFLCLASACVSAAYLALDIRFRWFWTAMYRATSFHANHPMMLVVVTLLLSAMSAAFTSGWVYNLVGDRPALDTR
jgi:hypothetical protein